MPDENGKLTAEDLKKIKTFVSKIQALSQCSQCNSPNWRANTHLLSLPSPSSSVYFPTVVLHCQACTSVRILSAIAIGIEVPGEKIENEGTDD